MNNEILQIYISDVLTYSIALIGIGFAIFTLAFSFIASKKDEIKIYERQIIAGDSSMAILRKRNGAFNFVKDMVTINRFAIWLLVVSLIGTIVLFSFRHITPFINTKYYLYIVVALFVIVIGESIPLLLVIWKALSRYAKLVKGPL